MAPAWELTYETLHCIMACDLAAVVVFLAGGVIGVAAGSTVSYFINCFDVITTLVTPDIVFLVVGVAVGIGLFFGFYPAWNTSRLNPIEALRSE